MLRTYRKIYDLLSGPERRRFGLLLFAIVFAALFEVGGLAGIMPFLAVLSRPELVETQPILAWLYRAGGFESHMAFATALGLALFATVLAGVGIRIVAIYWLTRFSMLRGYTIGSRLLQGYFAQPYTWFLGRHTAELSKTVLAEVERTVGNTLLPALRLISAATVSGCIVLLLLAVEPMVAIGAFVVLGGAYGAIYLGLRGLLLRLGHRRLALNKARFRSVHEAMGGAKEVKFMGLERVFVARFGDASREMYQVRSLEAVLGQAPRYIIEGVAFGAMIVGVLVMMNVRGGEMTDLAPLLGLIAVAVARLFPQLQQVYLNIATLRANAANLDHVRDEVMALGQAEPPAAAKAGGDERLSPRRSLALDAVHYAYPGAERTALRGLSLEIPTGTSVGIVGGTGAGKTTVVDLILGLLRPDQGAIRVDGEAVGDDRIRAWQRALGYVPQQIYLSDATVAENIAFGIPADRIDRAAVERAARVAALHDFVLSELPDGYDTVVGDRGARLSGGQRQRIGIARALYHDPDVLIMDEATSALDNLTEKAVMEAVYNIGREKTVIMIAHRLSTVKDCDVIYLLERGAVAASGGYDALFASSAAFRAMAEAR
ncbi:MAG: ABC transporter ATP-binding protein [Pseudomonadota bacterium]|nr:ABC transporter ATP-binding protein [Pseudomonadota bacterium]